MISETSLVRCPLCKALSHRKLTNGFLCCRLCSLAFTESQSSIDIDRYRRAPTELRLPNWNTLAFRAGGRLQKIESPLFAVPTAHIFASCHELSLVSLQTKALGPIFLPWPYGTQIKAHTNKTEDSKDVSNKRITLGIISRVEDWNESVALCLDMASTVSEAIVVLDTGDEGIARQKTSELAQSSEMEGIHCRVIARALENNFAEQRNVIQKLATHRWIVQLDTDERLTGNAKRLLGQIAVNAEKWNWQAVGFPRRNMVDGIWTALYPDVQYRLIEKSVRFTRAVHEYPDVRQADRTSVYLGAEMLHTIASSRLNSRAEMYEAISQGAGRPSDTQLLQIRFEA